MAAKSHHRSGSLVEISVDQVAPIFGVQLRGETCRADKIAKQDRDRAALGFGARRSRRRGRSCGRGLRSRRRRFACGESGDRPHQPLAVAERHADLLDVGLSQVRQDFRVDLMLAEQGFVLSEADRVRPFGDVHRRSRTRFDFMMVPWGLLVQVSSIGRPL